MIPSLHLRMHTPVSCFANFVLFFFKCTFRSIVLVPNRELALQVLVRKKKHTTTRPYVKLFIMKSINFHLLLFFHIFFIIFIIIYLFVCFFLIQNSFRK